LLKYALEYIRIIDKSTTDSGLWHCASCRTRSHTSLSGVIWAAENYSGSTEIFTTNELNTPLESSFVTYLTVTVVLPKDV